MACAAFGIGLAKKKVSPHASQVAYRFYLRWTKNLPLRVVSFTAPIAAKAMQMNIAALALVVAAVAEMTRRAMQMVSAVRTVRQVAQMAVEAAAAEISVQKVVTKLRFIRARRQRQHGAPSASLAWKNYGDLQL